MILECVPKFNTKVSIDKRVYEMIDENKSLNKHQGEKLNLSKIQISKIVQHLPKNQNDKRAKIGEQVTNDNNRKHQGHSGHHPLLLARHSS